MFCCWNPIKGRRQRKEWGDRWFVKVVVVGDSQCGKTSLIRRYCSGSLPTSYTPTLFDTTTVTSMVGSRKVQMIIQDTAGQEDLDRLRPPFYLHADVIIICFSQQNPDNWERVCKVWVPEARRYCGKHVPLLLVASKVDQADGQSSLTPDCLSSPIFPLPIFPAHVGNTSPFSQNHGQGISVVSPSSSVDEDPHLVFRDLTWHNNDKESASGSLLRDSGFFEWSENIVLGGTPPSSAKEDKRKRSLSGCARVEGGETKHAFSDRTDSNIVGDGQQKVGVSSGQQQLSGHNVARQIGAVGYFETSAVLYQGIEQVFETALTAAMAARQWRKKYWL